MYTLDFKSSSRLATAADSLQQVVLKVLEFYPVAVTCGHRGKDEQDRMYREKKSQFLFPQSKHNSYPSSAVDLVPVIDGNYECNNREQITHMAGFVLGVAAMLGVNLRWGGDWNQNHSVKDNKFSDLFHFELT